MKKLALVTGMVLFSSLQAHAAVCKVEVNRDQFRLSEAGLTAVVSALHEHNYLVRVLQNGKETQSEFQGAPNRDLSIVGFAQLNPATNRTIFGVDAKVSDENGADVGASRALDNQEVTTHPLFRGAWLDAMSSTAVRNLPDCE